MTYTLYPAILGILGLISAWIVYLKVKNSPEGDGKVKEISDEIHKGAMIFMAREYRPLAIFAIICIIALFLSLGWETALAFALGAICSGTAGYIGMYSATKANVRTAVAARDKGPRSSFFWWKCNGINRWCNGFIRCRYSFLSICK